MLHEVTDSEGELENELEETFQDCFEDEGEIIANVNNNNEFRDEDFVWGSSETKESATLSFNKMEQPKVLLHIHDAKNLTVECKQADLLCWHYCLGHSPFEMLKALATIRILPCHLSKAQTPVYPSCSFAKMHQNPWQTKGQHNGKIGKRTNKTHIRLDSLLN